MSTTVELHNQPLIESAIEEVRNDKSEVNWIILNHFQNDPNKIAFVAKGSDGLSGMVKHFDTTSVCYGLLRTTETVDMSVTVKFVYVYFAGDGIPFVKRGKFGVVKGDATRHLQPFHVDFDISHSSEVSESLIKQKISEAAGTAIKYRDAGSPEGQQMRGYTQSSNTGLNRSNPQLGSNSALENIKTESISDIKFGESLKDAIASVRDDSNPTAFSLGCYRGKKEIELLQKGSKESEWLPCFTEDRIVYGLFRFVYKIDNSDTVKFIFVSFVGPKANVMLKARISTHKGAVDEVFSPYHISVDASDVKELRRDELVRAIQK